MKFSRSSCACAATFGLLVQLANCQFAQLLPAQKATQIDSTSLIINFHESIGEPDTVAMIASVDAEPEAFRSAAEAQSRAAAAAAERITQMANNAGITIVRSETFGHVMTGMLLKVASEADGQKLSELLNADSTLGIKSLSHVVSACNPADASVAKVTAPLMTELSALCGRSFCRSLCYGRLWTYPTSSASLQHSVLILSTSSLPGSGFCNGGHPAPVGGQVVEGRASHKYYRPGHKRYTFSMVPELGTT